MKVEAFWLPEDVALPRREQVVTRGDRSVTVVWAEVGAESIERIAQALRSRRREVLARRSVAEIADTLDAVAARWLDPDYALRREAVASISALTGFSAPMVEHAIDLEQVSSRRGDILAALDRELGDHRALDGFVPTAKGRATAVGPELIGGIFSANIPALPHLTVMRAFVTKAACLGRVSRGEPAYLPLYARSIAELDPELASCLAVVHWDSARHDVEAAFLRDIDHLVAYGSDRTLGELRERAPAGLRATWHGHRMGFAWVGRQTGDVEALAERLAYDFTVFDQHACLAPQACFVERGGEIAPEALAEALARHLAAWAEKLPPRVLSVREAAGLRSALDAATVRAAMGEGEVYTAPHRLQGAVVLETPDAFTPGPLDRFARVIPVDGPDHLVRYLRPVQRYLQCAAVAGAGDALRRTLAELGVTRLCPPGAMGTPSMVWAHDGRPCLGDLVRWCDEETVAPG